MRTCIQRNATEERLLSLIKVNLSSLETLIDYNARNEIHLFRISSDLIPFGSSVAKQLPWQNIFQEKFGAIGQKIRDAKIRVSMHPGQYTVLNSPDPAVVERSVEDLVYHSKVLDALGLGSEHKLILHLGGAYGDKSQAKSRFVSHYRNLDASIKSRLVLENDDTLFNIRDVLETVATIGAPVVFDNLHNQVNPADKNITDFEWIKRCSETWNTVDGPQKMHYSQQNPEKKPGAHSDSIDVQVFVDYYKELAGMEIDIMLEVKDKNLSALKCIHCVSNSGIRRLEEEWARYKYLILERAPHIYQKIRELLRDKHSYPAQSMYQMIEAALTLPVVAGHAVNAAQHVWGYFKSRASESEKKRFGLLLSRLISGEGTAAAVKSHLLSLALKYNQDYLLNGYYLYK